MIHMDLLAQGTQINPTLFPPARFGNIGTLMNLAIPVIVVASTLVLLVILAMGAFKFITSEGSAEKVGKAKNQIKFAIAGFVLIMASFLITRLFAYIFNIDLPF